MLQESGAAVLVILCLPAAASAQNESGQPTKFQWEYKFNEEPGQRYWTRTGSTWTERYPSGYNKTYRVVRAQTASYEHGTVKITLQGTVVELAAINGKPVSPYITIFIPDVGSSKPWLLADYGGKWGFIGLMQNIV